MEGWDKESSHLNMTGSNRMGDSHISSHASWVQISDWLVRTHSGKTGLHEDFQYHFFYNLVRKATVGDLLTANTSRFSSVSSGDFLFVTSHSLFLNSAFEMASEG
ncbi:MAG: hypothetical protein ACRDAQ_04060 [Cetobacterium sp.]